MTKENKVKHPYHTLLPIHMQRALMEAAAMERIEMVDAAVRKLQEDAPHWFHDEKSVANRKFYHEPRQLTPHAGFVVPFPAGVSRS